MAQIFIASTFTDAWLRCAAPALERLFEIFRGKVDYPLIEFLFVRKEKAGPSEMQVDTRDHLRRARDLKYWSRV